MADIRQAALWMKDGKSVRRKGWGWCRYKIVGHGIIALYGRHNRITNGDGIDSLSDLLADDWEIAE